MKATNCKLFSFGIATASVLTLILFQLYPAAQAQNTTAFTTADKFNIPQLNGSISFAYNGTYSSAALQNNTWFFRDLTLNDSVVRGNLSISVQNSKIIIYSFYSDQLSITFNRYSSLRYWADGAGSQTINLHLKSTRQTHSSEWGIVNPSGVFLAEGHEWLLSPGNIVTVVGRTGNISVAHYGFATTVDSNEPFYIQHSVAIITIGVVAATFAVAGLISFKVRRKF